MRILAPALLIILFATGCSSPNGPSGLQGAWEGSWILSLESRGSPFDDRIRLVVSPQSEITGAARLHWPAITTEVLQLDVEVTGILLGNRELCLRAVWEVLAGWNETAVETGSASLRGRLGTDGGRFVWNGDFPWEIDGPIEWDLRRPSRP